MESKTREIKIIDLSFSKEENDRIAEIINSVLGQMSDGIWENSKTVEKYWAAIDEAKSYADGVWLEINAEKSSCIFGNRYYENPFYDKSDKEVKKYIATKLKQVFKTESVDENTGDWKRDNDYEMTYLCNWKRPAKVYEAYRVYDILMERNISKFKYGEGE